MKPKDYTIEALLICLLMAILGSCSKENPDIIHCHSVIQWSELHNERGEVVGIPDTCIYFKSVCDTAILNPFIRLSQKPPQQWCNTNYYIRTEIK